MKCGLSGRPIKQIAIKKIREIKLHDVPIWGCGGIYNYNDALDFINAGASAVQIASAAIENINVLKQISSRFNRL